MYDNLEEKVSGLIDKIQAFPDKRTKEQTSERLSLMTEARAITKTLDTLTPIITSMTTEGTDTVANLKDVHEALKGDDSEAVQQSILSIFGSRKGATLANSASLTKIIGNPKISETVKTQVKNVQAYQTAEEDLTRAQSKDTATVHSDIIEGGKGFKGIKTYIQAITTCHTDR